MVLKIFNLNPGNGNGGTQRSLETISILLQQNEQNIAELNVDKINNAG
jgi:hypothetical protein